MEYILDSVRRIVSRWVNTRTRITSDVDPGDTSLQVVTTNRFEAGDEILLRNSTQGETPIFIDEIVDETNMTLEDAIRFQWTVDDGCIIEKTFNQNIVQAVYIGNPDVIPRYPAITVSATNRDSEWMTLDSTKETYNLQIAIYVKDSNQEDAYRFLLGMVDTLQYGLKQNIYPLVGPFNTTTTFENIDVNDTFIKVNDIDLFEVGCKIHVEDSWNVQEFIVRNVVDSETLEVSPPCCYAFTVANNSQVVKINRFFFNSWPASIEYGTVFKGTMLKAATINWFAWEEEIQTLLPRETNIL